MLVDALMILSAYPLSKDGRGFNQYRSFLSIPMNPSTRIFDTVPAEIERACHVLDVRATTLSQMDVQTKYK